MSIEQQFPIYLHKCDNCGTNHTDNSSTLLPHWINLVILTAIDKQRTIRSTTMILCEACAGIMSSHIAHAIEEMKQ